MKSMKALTRLVGIGLTLGAVSSAYAADGTILLLTSQLSVHSLTPATRGTPSMPETTWIRLGPLPRADLYSGHSLLGPVFEYIQDPIALKPIRFDPESDLTIVRH